MTRRYIAAVLALLAGTSPLQAQTSADALSVFVTAAPVTIDGETEEQRQAAFADRARKSKELEATLQAQYGKKRERWPASAQELSPGSREQAFAVAETIWSSPSPPPMLN